MAVAPSLAIALFLTFSFLEYPISISALNRYDMSPPSPTFAPPNPYTYRSNSLPAIRHGAQYSVDSVQELKGTHNMLVLMVDFSDQVGGKLGGTAAKFRNLYFGEKKGQLNHYWAEVSYGVFRADGAVYDPSGAAEWYRSSETMAYWGEDSDENADDANDSTFELAREAVKLADPDIDFATFDSDRDGALERNELVIAIVHAGDDQASTGRQGDIWSHAWQIYGEGFTCRENSCPDTFVDGKRISAHRVAGRDDDVGVYFTVSETEPLGIIAHEGLHALGNVPDLYDYDYSSYGIGVWGLMAKGGWRNVHPEAWTKVKLGWTRPVEIRFFSNDASIPASETPSAVVYKLAINSQEYFLVENRQLIGYDAALPGAGLLIWHVDESKSNNDDDNDRLVDLEEAHGGKQHLDDYAKGNPGDAGDTWKSKQGLKGFTDSSDPNCNSKSGQDTELWVTDISTSSNVMTADFREPGIYLDIQPDKVVAFPRGEPNTATFNITVMNFLKTRQIISVNITNAPTSWGATLGKSTFDLSASTSAPTTVTIVPAKETPAGRVFTLNLQAAAKDGSRNVTLPFMVEIGIVQLKVKVSTDKNEYIPSQTVPIEARIEYPNNETVSEGYVAAYLSHDGAQQTTVELTFSSASQTWKGVYTSNLRDQLGTWIIRTVPRDHLGNSGSGEGPFTFIRDNTPPTVMMETPANNTFVNDVFLVSFAFSDDAVVAEISVLIDGRTERAVMGPSTSRLSIEVNTTVVADGGHIIQVIVVDGFGNRSVASTAVTVDNTPPEIIDVKVTPSTPIIGQEILWAAEVRESFFGVGVQSVYILYNVSGSPFTAPMSLKEVKSAGEWNVTHWEARLSTAGFGRTLVYTVLAGDHLNNTVQTTPHTLQLKTSKVPTLNPTLLPLTASLLALLAASSRHTASLPINRKKGRRWESPTSLGNRVHQDSAPQASNIMEVEHECRR